jgi:pantothenate kinase
MSPVIGSPFLARLEDLLADGQRKLLGLVGPPGGGKSTLAQALLAALPGRAVVVPMDGFHLANAELSDSDAPSEKVRRTPSTTRDTSRCFVG